MPVDPDHIGRVLDAFEQEEWDEIHLVTADVEIHLIAAPSSQQEAETSHASPVISPAGSPPADPPPADPPPAAAPASPPPAAAPDGTDLTDSTHRVVAPTPGLFWRAPSPGAPPFTELGERVERGAAVCIVELMKLMNTLSATVTGTVVEICARDGERVDAGRVLFRIRAEEP
jgi:acetyl-CoA carboxylase biotin carboxyl carrier protein